jgi:hypothetical protein
LTITGGATNILFYAGANGLWILNNIITNTSCPSNQVSVQGYNSNWVYFQGNQVSGCAGGSGNTSDTVGLYLDDGASHVALYFTDNIINGCNRFCIELAGQPGTTAGGEHFDRNTFSNFDGGATGGTACTPSGGNATAALSAVVPGTTAPTNTIWGNHLIVPASDKSCVWGVETAAGYTSIQYNEMDYVGQAFVIGTSSGTGIQNNTILLNTTGMPSVGYLPGGAGTAEAQDGGYNATEWVGSNTINGTVVNSGCLNSTGTGAPKYCGPATVSPWPVSFGTQPTVVQPSPIYPPG